jgi:hypothetical protein
MFMGYATISSWFCHLQNGRLALFSQLSLQPISPTLFGTEWELPLSAQE